MLQLLELENFKCFDRFELRFREFSILVGPNNAGKSTVISALRAAAAMVRYARRRRPPTTGWGNRLRTDRYPISPSQIDMQQENLRYEFRPNQTTQFRLKFANGTWLTAVW